MRAVDIIRKKRDGQALTELELAAFVVAASTGKDWEKYQLSALLMAIFFRGMNPEETALLTKLMTNSGKRFDLSDIPGPKVDKHSTGGVGDKTSLILAPLAVACGVTVPMMSGRGLGHTGGTLDKLEAIPGFRVHLSEAEFRDALRKVRVGMMGQTADVAPADKTLYALRDVTGTVECLPLITSSILSKKLAEGIEGLVMDVKCGQGAFMKTHAHAKQLAETIVHVSKLNGLRCEAVITAMEQPLGNEVGNSLEVIESLETLKGRGPKDLTDLSVDLAARMVRLAGIAKTQPEAEAKVRAALTSGAGVEVFRRMVEQQGGDPKIVDDYKRLPHTEKTMTVASPTRGFLSTMNAEKVGVASMLLGGGRSRAEDRIDPSVGITVRAKPGMAISDGEAIFTVHYRDESRLKEVQQLLDTAYTFSETTPTNSPLILEQLT